IAARQLEYFELRHLRQMPQAFIGDSFGTAQVERCDVIQLSQALQHVIRHQPRRAQSGEPLVEHDLEDLVPSIPWARRERPERIALPKQTVERRGCTDSMCRLPSGTSLRDRRFQLRPRLKAAELSDE